MFVVLRLFARKNAIMLQLNSLRICAMYGKPSEESLGRRAIGQSPLHILIPGEDLRSPNPEHSRRPHPLPGPALPAPPSLFFLSNHRYFL